MLSPVKTLKNIIPISALQKYSG